MKFQEYEYYKHDYVQDTVIEVLRVYEQSDRRAKLMIRYWVIGDRKKLWRVDMPDSLVNIDADNMELWRVFYDNQPQSRFFVKD